MTFTPVLQTTARNSPPQLHSSSAMLNAQKHRTVHVAIHNEISQYTLSRMFMVAAILKGEEVKPFPQVSFDIIPTQDVGQR